MQERKHGVERLLNAIYQNIDDNNISMLARILNYHEPQLKEDIEAVRLVEISNKGDKPQLENYKEVYTENEENRELHVIIPATKNAESNLTEWMDKSTIDSDDKEAIDQIIGQIARAYEMQGFLFGANCCQDAN